MRRLSTAAILVMAAIGVWAIGTGQVSYVVTYGVSMNPVYYHDDLIIVVKSDSYHVGEIVAYRASTPGVKVLHRIVGGDASTGYVFKGDNNRAADVLKPTGDRLIGRASLHIPKGGIWLKPLLGPTGLGMISFLIIGGGAAGPRTRREVPRGRRKKRVKAMARQGGSWAVAASIMKGVGRLPLVLRVAAATTALLAIMAITLGVFGWMKPVAVRTPGTAPAQSLTFSYTATVPRSPAYDGTRVTSPDPVFRKLTHIVDLHMRYQGFPGVFDATATLTNGSGWHTAIQLVPATKFSSSAHEALAILDLGAIDARATAAATAIGIAPATVSIAVAARVTSPGRPAFRAPLALALTPLQLTLTDGDSGLAVKDPTGTTPTIRPREIAVGGFALMPAARARSLAVLLFLVAAAGTIVLAVFARRDLPVRTRPEIERRFPQLLVHVEPMQSPPGKPVVNVDNFPALVKLAERYGQMILTWRRPEADDFVVRDEGITYRYRIHLDEETLENIEHLDRPPGAGTHRRRAPSEVS